MDSGGKILHKLPLDPISTNHKNPQHPSFSQDFCTDSRGNKIYVGAKMGAFERFRPSILAIVLLTVFVDLILVTNAQTGSEYLDPHNAARGTVGAAPLMWSAQLADYALGYAETQVNQCLPLTHSHGEYGENLFWGSGKVWTPLEAVTAWTDEIADYDYATNSCKAQKMCGHYTQVVWKSTTHVGCASVKCNDGATYIICSYDPPGNWIGERPY